MKKEIQRNSKKKNKNKNKKNPKEMEKPRYKCLACNIEIYKTSMNHHLTTQKHKRNRYKPTCLELSCQKKSLKMSGGIRNYSLEEFGIMMMKYKKEIEDEQCVIQFIRIFLENINTLPYQSIFIQSIETASSEKIQYYQEQICIKFLPIILPDLSVCKKIFLCVENFLKRKDPLCGICLEEKGVFYTLSCKHSFHRDCIIQGLIHSHFKCSLCRKPF